MTAVALEATRIRVRQATLFAVALVVVVAMIAWWASVPYVVGVWHETLGTQEKPVTLVTKGTANVAFTFQSK